MLYRSRTPHKGPVVLLSGRLGFFRRFVGPIWFLRLFLRMGREHPPAPVLANGQGGVRGVGVLFREGFDAV